MHRLRFLRECSLCGAALLGAIPPAAKAQVFPGSSWETRTPAEMGLDATKLQALQDLVGGSGMIVRGGYQVWTWGNISILRNWASASKPVISTVLFKADSDGLCSIDSEMGDFHVGGSAKDRSITFRNLANMTSGYSRGEGPGEAWAYNDYAINLYGYTLFHEVYGGAPSAVLPAQLSFLQFEDSFVISDAQYGRLIGVSIRDFARIGLFWLNDGTWDGTPRIPPSYFDLVTNQVPESLPLSTMDGPESWDFGTFGGGDNQDPLGPGEYGFNFWINTNGFWPGVPGDVYQANGHSGDEVCTVFPSFGIVALGIGVWGHPSTAALQLIVGSVVDGTSVGEGVTPESWGAIKAIHAR